LPVMTLISRWTASRRIHTHSFRNAARAGAPSAPTSRKGRQASS
jgi:hypothetical protein